MAIVLSLILIFFQLQTATAVSSLTVDTSSGTVTGFVNSTTPYVAQFLGIPYAEPPIGERRWLPSIVKSKEDSIDATQFGLSCPQYEANASSIFSEDVPEFNTPANMGEDCLSVNVWTPWRKSQNSSELLPVIAWLYGGAFQTGGGNIAYQNPSRWIERSQRHIVVSINFRGNIFGYPNARGLNDTQQNLGLLDQRLALEWIRTNIANFGGDPLKISLWGQSSGGMAVDYYNYVYLDDPIVSGLIMDSGTALIDIGANDPGHTNFTFVAQHFGCGNLSAAAELDCLRKISSTEITTFLKAYYDAGVSPTIAFSTFIDNHTVFANYTERALAGNFTKKPAILGLTHNDGAVFLPYDRQHGPDPAEANATTLSWFLCPIIQETQDRYAVGAPTYRYLYGGNFSNISPQWWEGAYHQSELPLVFGTHDIARGPSTAFETQVSMHMQDYWVAFATDPIHGLAKLGWNAYEPGGNDVLIGWKDVVSQPIAESKLGAPCDGLIPKEGAFPPP